MYAATTGTFLQRDPIELGDAPILEFSHEAVTALVHGENGPMRTKHRSAEDLSQRALDDSASQINRRDIAEEQNLYSYVRSNPINLVDPTGLYATPGYGHFCGPRNGQDWDGISPLDCLDQACKWHDECVGTLFSIFPGKLAYCDQILSLKAYYCATFGCETVGCQIAAVTIGAWMALPGGGTCPIGPFPK